jgi:hypothetical protein
MLDASLTVIKVLSYGGGLDSFAMLLDAIKRGELPHLVVFCDVGDPNHEKPGEWPGTYQHIREVVIPLCEQHGIEFVWIVGGVPRAGLESYQAVLPIREGRPDEAECLWDWFFTKTSLPGALDCRGTMAAKVERFNTYLARRFAEGTVEAWIGYDAAETGRLGHDHDRGQGELTGRRINRFPLMEQGYCRCRCEKLARDSGLPVPRKSACTFCGKNTKGDLRTLAAEKPEDFRALAELERKKNQTPTGNGKHLVIKGHKAKFADAPATEDIELEKLQTAKRGVSANLLIGDAVHVPYRNPNESCSLCGAEKRAVKTAGCGYLTEAEYDGNKVEPPPAPEWTWSGHPRLKVLAA